MAPLGIQNAVFVQCYNDSPEEVDWVFEQVLEEGEAQR